MIPESRPLQVRHVVLATVSFAVCFAAWGLISAFAPRFRDLYGLSGTQTAFLVAVPVLLGAVGRIPVGMLADRFGGRLVFGLLMLIVAAPVAVAPFMETYGTLLAVAFFLGLAGASFPVGIGYVSRWTSADRQGSALGLYGLGNAGQSLAVFGGPLLVGLLGLNGVFLGAAALLAVWGVAFLLLARDAPGSAQPKSLGYMLGVLARERLSWALSAFYFLTFGGFVAFSIYLPTLLKDEFGLTPADAGFRTAGFVVLATATRPLGGWLSDRIGGSRVLSGVFLGAVPFALLMTWPSMLPFTVGALGCAALLGAGNGAVFKLVPQYFPGDTGTVTGLVGAMGGLGGFFPPLLLGFFRDTMGTVWPGLALLAVASLCLWALNRRLFVPRQEALELTLPPEMTRTANRLQAGLRATLWTGLLVAAIVVGSRNLQHFDPALVVYTFATIFATWGVVYHYAVWLQKPPTRLYWRRGWQLFLANGPIRSGAHLAGVAATHLFAQRFIARRGWLRWSMHQCLFWGCVLAAAVTFPLVFGWIHFGTLPDNQMVYVAYVFGFPVHSFWLQTLYAWMVFHVLDIAAVLVIAGIGMSLWRRMRDQGAQAVQSFGMDMVPLIVLFAISLTGLALTASSLWLRGKYYDFLAIIHAITVIAALLYLPFGKFFHIFQRPAQLGVKLYHRVGDAGEDARCTRCGERFASRLHIEDLKRVLPELGFDYRMEGPAGHWQEFCPACKRRTLAAAQLRLKEESDGETATYFG